MAPATILDAFQSVLTRIESFKEHARAFYFQVVLDGHTCTHCSGRLSMTGPSECTCITCGQVLDPTMAFQLSACCASRLVRRRLHYACAKCGQITPSRFLFDERVFDDEYFAVRMRESRQAKQTRLERVRQLLAASRSPDFAMDQIPSLDSVPGLVQSLDEFVGYERLHDPIMFLGREEFRLDAYRERILQALTNDTTRFSAIPPICTDPKRDRARRFTTLVFMEHVHEIHLTQYGNDLLVRRHETDMEGL